MHKTILIFATALFCLAASVLKAEEKVNDLSTVNQVSYPKLEGKGPGMGHDYQKNTPRTEKGKPNFQGGQTNSAEPSSTDFNKTDNQLSKPVNKEQQIVVEEKDKTTNSQDKNQKTLNTGSQTSSLSNRKRGSGTGFPGYRGQGGTGYPQHRQFGSPPTYPLRNQTKKSSQLKNNTKLAKTIVTSPTDNRRALLHAAAFGDLATVSKLLEQGVSANAKARDRKARTALILASAGGHTEIVDTLITNEAKINERDLTGHTALNWAAMRGHIKTVSLLLKKGADINTRDNGDVTPMLYAVGTQNPAMVKLLADKGADLEVVSRENKMTPLLLAIEHKNLKIIKILIDKGVKTNKKSLEMIKQIKSKLPK